MTDSTTPEAGHFQFQYNSFDLLTQRTDTRGVVTTYSYDSLNRAYQVIYNVGSTGVPATPTVTFTYDEGGAAANALGRLTTVADGVGTEKYNFNILGQTTQLHKVISGITYTMQYAYNLAGELNTITYPSGRVLQQNYDAVGRLCAVGASGATCSTGTNYANGLAYNPAGEATTFNYGNGVATNMTYSADRLQMTALSYTKASTTLLSMNYWYKTDATNCPSAPASNNGQIQCITDGVDAGRNETFTYDALYRLTSAVTKGSAGYPQWGLSFSYDRYGNRTNQTVTAGTAPANSVAISAPTNHITGTGYAYDANGNMSGDGSNTLTFDAENHEVTSSGSLGSGTYTYDGNGLRVKKVSGSTTTTYIFSGSKVIAEYDNGAAVGSPSREYVYLGSQLLAKFESGGTTYYHPDHLSNRVLSDASGTSSGQRGHYPFGETWYETGTTTKIKFTSYERDSESGNDYAMARTDISRLGRFMSPDPVGGQVVNPQSLNRYSYVQNDPIDLADPSGAFVAPQLYELMRSMGAASVGDLSDEFAMLEFQTGTSYHFYTLNGHGFDWFHCSSDQLFQMAATGEEDIGVSSTPIYEMVLIGPSGGGGGSAQTRIEKARDAARLLLSNKDCADFLKSVLSNLGLEPLEPVLDNFLKEFDRLSIVPTPSNDSDGPDWTTTAHPAGGIGASTTVHVDAPGASDLVPTLLHETFHDIKYAVTEPDLAAAAGNPVPTSTPADQQDRVGSRNASAEFDKHCTPKK